jgi:hypothetical protein
MTYQILPRILFHSWINILTNQILTWIFYDQSYSHQNILTDQILTWILFHSWHNIMTNQTPAWTFWPITEVAHLTPVPQVAEHSDQSDSYQNILTNQILTWILFHSWHNIMTNQIPAWTFWPISCVPESCSAAGRAFWPITPLCWGAHIVRYPIHWGWLVEVRLSYWSETNWWWTNKKNGNIEWEGIGNCIKTAEGQTCIWRVASIFCA